MSSHRSHFVSGSNLEIGGTIEPIKGTFLVEPSGKVALGLGYGRVNIKGLSLEQAETSINEHMLRIIKSVGGVSVTRPIPDNPSLERRVRDLENEVRDLRSNFDELRTKMRQWAR